MAAFETSRPAPFGAISRHHHGKESFLARMVAAYKRWNEMRITRQELLRLTDRELDDIGISRADIANIENITR